MLPQAFGKLHSKTRALWVAILACAFGWAMCLCLSFERLALAVLRIREADLPRPFRVPGGMFGAIAVGIAPVLMLGFAILRSQKEQVLGMSSFAFGLIPVGAGVVAYWISTALEPNGWAVGSEERPRPAIKSALLKTKDRGISRSFVSCW
jgi:hypothetical protein